MLLIFPPQWTPISPYFALPSLLGQLKNTGYKARALDLNIKFFNEILTQNSIKDSFLKIAVEFENSRNEITKFYSPSKKSSDYTLEEQILMFKYNKLKAFLSKDASGVQEIISFIEIAKNIIKSDDFYNPKKLINSMNIIDKALEVVSLPYYPNKIAFEGLVNPFFKFNYESINYFVNDEASNIFKKYYEENFDEIIKYNPDFIGISINSSSQIIPGLTLSKMLKEKTSAHVNIGGNFFGRITNELSNHPEFFETYTHSVSIEEGEGPIVEVAKYVNGEISIDEVPNLLYLKEDKVCQNKKMTPVKLTDMACMDLEDYDFNQYFSPKPVIPYQSSRGCYWGKCSFCDQDFGQNLNVKQTDKVIEEFKELKEKYNISDFEFIDESVSPKYLDELSQKIIENNLDVRYFFDARLETEFTKEVLKKGYDSGLRMILWGLESGSMKIMELINKGIDLTKRFDILKDCADCSIWNFAFIFFGFPAETKNDATKTVKMLTRYKDIIHSYGRSVYTMGRHSKLADDPLKYGITKIYPAEEEFSPNINFECSGMNKKELNEMLSYCLAECSKVYKNPLWMYLRHREYLFLYISKYGLKRVKDYDFNKNKDI